MRTVPSLFCIIVQIKKKYISPKKYRFEKNERNHRDKGVIIENLEENLLVFGDPNKVQNKVLKLILSIGSDGRFIFNSDCHFPTIIPFENIVGIIGIVEKYR